MNIDRKDKELNRKLKAQRKRVQREEGRKEKRNAPQRCHRLSSLRSEQSMRIVSHRIQAQPVNSSICQGKARVGRDRSSPLNSVIVNDGKHKCLSPVCEVEFEPSGLDIKPRRYCCPGCRMDVFMIKQVSTLFEGLTDRQVLAIMRGK